MEKIVYVEIITGVYNDKPTKTLKVVSATDSSLGSFDDKYKYHHEWKGVKFNEYRLNGDLVDLGYDYLGKVIKSVYYDKYRHVSNFEVE